LNLQTPPTLSRIVANRANVGFASQALAQEFESSGLATVQQFCETFVFMQGAKSVMFKVGKGQTWEQFCSKAHWEGQA